MKRSLTGPYVTVGTDYDSDRVVGHTSDLSGVDVLSVLVGTEGQIH